MHNKLQIAIKTTAMVQLSLFNTHPFFVTKFNIVGQRTQIRLDQIKSPAISSRQTLVMESRRRLSHAQSCWVL